MTFDNSIIRRCETRVRQLILSYEEQCKANDTLSQQLQEKQEEIDALKAELSSIQKEYNALLTIRTIETHTTDLSIVKTKVNSMLKEVEKCLELMRKV